MPPSLRQRARMTSYLTASANTDSATSPTVTGSAATASREPERAARQDPRTEIRLDRTARRIRVYFAGDVIADSVSAEMSYVTGHHAEYAIPVSDITWTNLVVDDVALRD